MKMIHRDKQIQAIQDGQLVDENFIALSCLKIYTVDEINIHVSAISGTIFLFTKQILYK